MPIEYTAWVIISFVISIYLAPVAYGIHKGMKKIDITGPQFMGVTIIISFTVVFIVVLIALFFKFFGWLF